ncbi:hypothetical protein Tdes44962_MAKER03645 [Teratosphaeria destructans]|uniref:Transfer RNA methyltransferase 82 n=1 Tax=Teratosphaeria destructans TaxID=418781 RepID=A0A9W7SPA4_9PEZI|nr:hypothetical protein Tdes44962_MAKER03645 [Teratosphaeria destructans]
MQHPIQLVATVSPKEHDQLVLAACGPYLVSVSLGKDRIVSKWAAEEATAQIAHNGKDGDEEPPAKKKRTAANGNAKPILLPNIIKLVTSPNQDYAVIVTDDKRVHVLAVRPDGGLGEVSQRIMPKRPCAIQILPDNDTIIIGDKFGDVYSLPLIPATTGENADIKPDQPGKSSVSTPQSRENQTFKPAATILTVHSKRNRRALEAQKQQKNFTPKKEALEFEHKLLLGHVSMLTDAVFTLKEVDGIRRGYIITADRDEHIRISRGPPQAHIIEGYCLGHTEYISKLCLIGGTDMLISGGGDDWLGIWDWPTFTLRRKFSLQDDVLNLLKTTGHEKEVEKTRFNVSGLWAISYSAHHSRTSTKEPALAVALERKPMLLIIPVSVLQTKAESQHTVHRLPAPPLDVAVLGESIIVTLDARKDGQSRIQALKLESPAVENQVEGLLDVTVDEKVEEKIKCLTNEAGIGQEMDEKALDGLLYGVADLRKKRGGGEGGDEKDAEADEGDPQEADAVDD